MLIKGILIGFLMVIIPTVIINFFPKKLKKWLEESVNSLLLYDIAIIVFFVGFRTNAFIETVVENIKVVNPYTIQYLIKNVVSSGLLLVAILLIIGWITRWLYKIGTRIFNMEKYELEESDVEIIFILAALICILLNIATDGWESMTYLSIFVILLGKVVWIDTTPNKFFELIKKLFTEKIKSTRVGLILLIVVVIWMLVPVTIEWKTAVGVWIGLVISMILLTVIGIKKSKNK